MFMFVCEAQSLFVTKICFNGKGQASGLSYDASHAVHSTCDHAVRVRYTLEHLLDEPDVSARLQVADTLLEDGGEDAPHLGLTGGLTFVQQLHHAHDALRLLDDEVHLQVKLATDQLEGR